jgi:hypothetical protein
VRTRALAIAGGVAALLAISSIAIGALDLSSKRFRVAQGDMAQRVAKCDVGKAVSGGFRGAFTGTGSAMLALDSTLEGIRGWRFRTLNQSEPGRATAHVYCKRKTPRLGTASDTTTIPNDQLGSAEAQCPKGKEAVAGGFDSPSAASNLVGSKRTDSRSWRVTFFNTSGSSRDYQAFAYCDRREPGLTTKTKLVGTNPSARFNQSGIARCGRPQKVRSGGFEIDYEGTGELSNKGIVHASRLASQRSWRVTAVAAIGNPVLRVYAYCK